MRPRLQSFGGRILQRRLSRVKRPGVDRFVAHGTTQENYGLPYDPVFVFPQGRFSSVAMQVLKEHGFYAGFNSTIRATDTEDPPDVEYQQPYTKIYHDFPLFLRRYPKDRSLFAQDLSHGRPIIIVEHHDVFQERL